MPCEVLAGVTLQTTYRLCGTVIVATRLQPVPVAPDLFLTRKSVCRWRVFEPSTKAPRLTPYRSRGPDRQQSPLNGFGDSL
jgi:hypothetical protein